MPSKDFNWAEQLPTITFENIGKKRIKDRNKFFVGNFSKK